MRVEDRRVSEGSSLCRPGGVVSAYRRVGVSAFAKRYQLRRDFLCPQRALSWRLLVRFLLRSSITARVAGCAFGRSCAARHGGTRSRASRRRLSDNDIRWSNSDRRWFPARPARHVHRRRNNGKGRYAGHSRAGMAETAKGGIETCNAVKRRTRRSTSTMGCAAPDTIIGRAAADRAGARPYVPHVAKMRRSRPRASRRRDARCKKRPAQHVHAAIQEWPTAKFPRSILERSIAICALSSSLELYTYCRLVIDFATNLGFGSVVTPDGSGNSETHVTRTKKNAESSTNNP